MAAFAIKTRLDMPLTQAAIMARYDLGDYFQGQGEIGTVVDHLRSGLASYPDVIAYTLVDAGGELVYAQGVESDIGDTAINQSLAWAKQLRLEADPHQTFPSVTVLTPSSVHAVIGALFPVLLMDETVGALIVALDIRSAASETFGKDLGGPTGILFFMDPQGAIIYPRLDVEGASLPGLARMNLPDLASRMRAAPQGYATYSRNRGRFGFAHHRLLVSWQRVMVGQMSFMVCRVSMRDH
jgi:hypothetical protein